MSRITRFTWSPPGGGGYGVLGPSHPTLPQYRWIAWADGRPGKDGFGGGYYDKRTQFLVIGTDFAGRDAIPPLDHPTHTPQIAMPNSRATSPILAGSGNTSC